MRRWLLRPGTVRTHMGRDIWAAMHDGLSVPAIPLYRGTLQLVPPSYRLRWIWECMQQRPAHHDRTNRERLWNTRNTLDPHAAGACPPPAALDAVGFSESSGCQYRLREVELPNDARSGFRGKITPAKIDLQKSLADP